MAAEIILIPVAKLILGKASDLAKEQIGLLWNFRRELNKFKATVSTIQAVLRDAEEKQFHNHQVKDWLEKLSDIMYDAEDLLDDLATEARRKAVLVAATDGDDGGRRRTSATTCWSMVCFLFFSLPTQLVYDLKMAHTIKAIREKLDDITKDKDTLHLEIHTIEEESLSSRETDSCPPTIVVGRENDKKNIIELLLNSNPEANISVIPIVGMGGLGKTTLAQLVFDDDQVKAHFDIKAWVYVSQSFDVKVILGKMLRSIDCGSRVGVDLDVLQTRVREGIKGKRFLFVLDDVWEETDRSWETLGKYLTVGALGSKVLVTTRSKTVAEVGSGALKSRRSTSIVEPYNLKGLSEEESWNLLVEKSPPGKVPQDPQVQEIGKKILGQCGGVPLAVSSIAGVLIDSINPKIDWPSLLQMGPSSIAKGEDHTMSALQLSFNHLPSNMKHCFAYCKLFPKGYLFNVQMLVKFWVAQGYVESEDRGFDCFKTLWSRSFFHEVWMNELENMSSCKMHDLMHDLADSMAGEKIIRSSSSTVLKTIPPKTRHLLIYGDNDDQSEEDNDDQREEDYGDGLGNASKVRTLICWQSLSGKELEQVLNNFTRLRVLMIPEECSDSVGEEVLENIDKLKHLRYLGLHCNGRVKLPNSVTNLVNLQVLNLFGCELLQELPEDTKKLVNLKHLEMKSEELEPDQRGGLTHMPKGIGELKFLQTLPFFLAGNICDGEIVGGGLDDLKGLNALRGEFMIKDLANANPQRNGDYVLKEKLHIQSLILEWGCCDVFSGRPRKLYVCDPYDDEGILEMLQPHPNLQRLDICGGYGGVRIPNWLSGLTNLVVLLLTNCSRCEYLPPLHPMSSLKELKIEQCPILKGINNDGYHSEGEWPRFQCLSSLDISNCPMLTQLPTFPTIEGRLKLKNASLAPFAMTMKMRMGRGGGVDYSVECAYNDTNIHPLLPSSSALVHPLSKLTRLTLSCIDDDLESLAHYDRRICLIYLEYLTVYRCNQGHKLPGSLCSSIHLTEILVSELETLEYLPPLHELPSLRELHIEKCPNLKGCWWKKKQQQGSIINNTHHFNVDYDDYYYFDPSMEIDEKQMEEWPHFPCLSTLIVCGCPKLNRLPLFPSVKHLRLQGSRTEALLMRTMKMKSVVAAHHHHHLDSQQHSTTTTTAAATTITSLSSLLLGTALLTPLSKLTGLSLKDIDDLDHLPEEGICRLTSLRWLRIDNCPKLTSLPPAMRYATSLQSITIVGCPLLSERCRKGEGEDWPNISHIPTIQLIEGESSGSRRRRRKFVSRGRKQVIEN